MSPIVDVTYSRTQAEEKCFDVLIQDIRINLSVPFLMHLGRYFLDSLPGEQIEKGIINHGYDNNNQMVNIKLFINNKFTKNTFKMLFLIDISLSLSLSLFLIFKNIF